MEAGLREVTGEKRTVCTDTFLGFMLFPSTRLHFLPNMKFSFHLRYTKLNFLYFLVMLRIMVRYFVIHIYF